MDNQSTLIMITDVISHYDEERQRQTGNKHTKFNTWSNVKT